MTPERWAQIKEICGDALEKPEQERAAWLASACGADDLLRVDVERLLAQDDASLESPAAALLVKALPEFTVGDMLSHYRITVKLGEGGMGEVWRATDTKLRRDVAVKILPRAFVADADRLARFTREAQVLASLNHPNIAAIYGVEERALVMELVDGPTLAERILKGPMLLEETLPIARQIADALEYAHEHDIVHRDLKPANVKVTPDGRVKVLDFGLAKGLAADSIAGHPSSSPTFSLRATVPGMILGTAAYMSPEQAIGQPVDKRADIWSLGVVLWELLTGHRLFEGETVTDTLAGVLRAPIDFDKLPPRTPAAIRGLLGRCLDRNAKNRLRDIGEARITIESALAGETTDIPAPAPKMTTPWTAATVLAIAAAIGWWLFWLATRPVEYSLMRLSVDLGPEAMTGPNITAAISPDGRRLVFQARAPNGKRQLATRLLDQTQISLLPGTEDGETPFFSPDSEWVGFFADGKLKKTSVQRGAPVALCDAFVFYGGSWGEDGSIIAALNLQTGLSQVPAAGGRPQPLTRPRKGEVTHRWPQILPGGKSILFTASPTNIGMENASIEAMSLRNGVIKTLVSGGYFGRYVAVNGKSGYLVYLHQDELLAVGFNPDQLETRGTPMPLLEDVSVSPYLNGGGQFDFSEAPSGHGTFVYLAGKMTAPAWPVMWLDNSGKMQPFAITPGYYQQPRFSPDGRHLALTMRTTGGTDIYVYELGRETMTRITFGGHAQGPVWTPDGKHIAFQWSAGGFGIGWIRSDGSAEPRQILSTENLANPYSLSPDGRRLAYYENNPETGFDIWTLPLDGSDSDEPKTGKPEPFLVTPSEELAPMFSPDGRWIAYRSNESGTGEIYVRPFPGGRSGKWQVSTGRGRYAMWSNNRRELFYDTADDHIMVLNYTINGDSFVPAKPRLWSEKQIYMPGNTNLTLAPDSKRFAVFPRPEAGGQEKGSVHATFLLNFFDELRRRVPIAQR